MFIEIFLKHWVFVEIIRNFGVFIKDSGIPKSKIKQIVGETVCRWDNIFYCTLVTILSELYYRFLYLNCTLQMKYHFVVAGINLHMKSNI